MNIVKSSEGSFIAVPVIMAWLILMSWSVCLAAEAKLPPKAASSQYNDAASFKQGLTTGESISDNIRVIPLMPLPPERGFKKGIPRTFSTVAPAPEVFQSLRNDTSPPLREIASAANAEKGIHIISNMPLPKDRTRRTNDSASPEGGGPLVRTQTVGPRDFTSGVNFEGTNNVNAALPPDTVGDVGPNHYVQMINLSFQIFSKTGASLLGPTNNNTLWSGFGGICESNNQGDPIVLYDHLADRWLLSQFAFNTPNDFHQCIAISQTPDPTGAYHRYDFLISTTKLNDYPKFGVWPDGYYMSVNQFNGTTSAFEGIGAVVFERDKMLQGQAARMVYFDDPAPQLGGMLPSDLDGPVPPAGSPNFFVQFNDDGFGGFSQDQLEIWQFQTDWSNPANSTFSQLALLPTTPFDSNMCNRNINCIPQPDTSQGVDPLSDRLMFRVAYRNFGTHQSMVVNHTVDVDNTDHAGIRWYELRNAGQGWMIYQENTYAPDNLHRWMGSIAMDSQGNIALGYSVSSTGGCNQVFYNQNFEEGVVPPAGWSLIQTNQSETWKIQTVGPSHGGSFAADVEYDPTLNPQDEVLLTDALNITAGTLRFFSYGSLFWCRDDNNNCDLEVWIVPGAWDGGGGDDIFVGLADDDWSASFEWSQSTFDLSSLLPGGPVRIAFRYTGLDGAQIALDDISICTDTVSAVYPSIRYVGRLVSDPLNTLPRGENTIIDGSGSQTHTAARWGDYSAMSVDPVNDFFWYTQEYYETTSTAGWQTRIASFGLGGPTGGSLEGARFLLLDQDIP